MAFRGGGRPAVKAARPVTAPFGPNATLMHDALPSRLK